MAGFKLNPITLINNPAVLREASSLTGATSAINKVLGNSALGSIYDAVVPQSIKDTVNLALGGTNEETMRMMDRRRDPLLQFHHSVILPFNGDAAYVERVTLPAMNTEISPQHVNNSSLQKPGFVSVETASMTFYEDIGATAHAYVNEWSSKVVNGKWYGRPSEYKQDIIVTLHDSKGSPVIVCLLHGCWPSSWDAITAGPDNERVTLEVTFSVDWSEWQFPASEGFLSRLGIDLGSVFGKNTPKVSNLVGGQLQKILKA